MTRDSALLWLGVAIGVFGYLGTKESPATWVYADWVASGSFLLALAAAKLQSSPLKGKGSL